jgi:hypothetical protein
MRTSASVIAAALLPLAALAQTVLGPSPPAPAIPRGVDAFSLTVDQVRQYSAAENFEVLGHDYFKIPERTEWARAVGREGTQVGSGLSAVKVYDGIAYIGGYNMPPTLFGVLIADVRDPQNMKALAFIPCKPHTRCPYVDIDPQRKLLVFGNDPFRDPRKGRQLTPEQMNAEAGWSFYDVSQPDKPRELGFLSTRKGGVVHGLAIEGNYLYGCAQLHDDSYEILTIVDFGDPRRPRKLWEWHVPGQLKGETPEPQNRAGRDGKPQTLRCHISAPYNDKVYVAYRDAGMKIFDVKDRAKPRLIGTYDYVPPFTGGMLGATHTTLPIVVKPGDDPDLVVIADENYNCPASFGRVVDVSDLRHPQVIAGERDANFEMLSTFRLPQVVDVTDGRGGFICPGEKQNTPFVTQANGIHSVIQDLRSPSLLLATWYNHGLRAVDISNPFAPKFVGYYLSPKYASWENDDRRTREVAQDPITNLIYITDGNGGGLTVLRYTGPIPAGPPIPGAR